MAFREYLDEAMMRIGGGAGRISDHGPMITKMKSKLEKVSVNMASPYLRLEKKRVKLAQKAISELDKIEKLLNTIYYGKGM